MLDNPLPLNEDLGESVNSTMLKNWLRTGLVQNKSTDKLITQMKEVNCKLAD